MIRRVIHLYQEGGTYELILGINRFIRELRRNSFTSILLLTNNPKKSLRVYINYRRRIQPSRFTSADPFKIVYVDPEEIENAVTDVPTGWGKVVGGNWNQVPFQEVTVHGASLHRSNILHFIKGVPWKDTPIYQARYDAIESNMRGFECEQDILSYLESLDALYHNMKNSGYKTQSELLRKYKIDTLSRNNDEIHPTLNEIGVNIDKNGEILWSRCGKHRLSIAKILGIEKIPAQIRTRHSDWENMRRKIVSEKNPEARTIEHDDHADIIY